MLSMRKLAANSPVAPIKSSAIRGYARSNLTVSWKIEGYISAWWMLNIFIDSKSQLVKAFETFLEFAFAATPPATEFQSRQFVAPDHEINILLAKSDLFGESEWISSWASH